MKPKKDEARIAIGIRSCLEPMSGTRCSRTALDHAAKALWEMKGKVAPSLLMLSYLPQGAAMAAQLIRQAPTLYASQSGRNHARATALQLKLCRLAHEPYIHRLRNCLFTCIRLSTRRARDFGKANGTMVNLSPGKRRSAFSS